MTCQHVLQTPRFLWSDESFQVWDRQLLSLKFCSLCQTANWTRGGELTCILYKVRSLLLLIFMSFRYANLLKSQKYVPGLSDFYL